MVDEHDNLAEQLTEARRTIEQQGAQIDRMQAQHADREFINDLRNALLTTATVGTIGAPSTHGAALEAVVETAADVLDANAASLFLLEEDSDELMFVVALGEKADEVRQFRVPLGQGIAGYVAATGQPIAVADAEKDPRFAREIGEAIDYIPKTILCIPLFLGDRVIGVLELMDKVGGVPFSASDMEILGRFGNLAAHTIQESKLTHDMRHLFRSLLSDVVQDKSISEATLHFADTAIDTPGHSDVVRLAAMIHEISQHGEAARRLATDVLSSLCRYVVASAAI